MIPEGTGLESGVKVHMFQHAPTHDAEPDDRDFDCHALEPFPERCALNVAFIGHRGKPRM